MQRLTHNLGLKLLSFALAILLWTHVRGEVNPLETMTMDVPLKVKTPEGWRITNEVPAKVTVLLQGPRVSLRNLKGGALATPVAATDPAQNAGEGSMVATADPIQPHAGPQRVVIQPQSRVSDVVVLRASPTEIIVELEPQTGPH